MVLRGGVPWLWEKGTGLLPLEAPLQQPIVHAWRRLLAHHLERSIRTEGRTTVGLQVVYTKSTGRFSAWSREDLGTLTTRWADFTATFPETPPE